MSEACHVRGIRWIVTGQCVPTISAITSLSIQTCCAICADGDTASVTTICGCERFGGWPTALNGHIGTIRPDLICLLGIPTETDNIITGRHIGYVHLVHYAKIEIKLLELLWGALHFAAGTSTRAETVHTFDWRLECWPSTFRVRHCTSRNRSVAWWNRVSSPCRIYWNDSVTSQRGCGNFSAVVHIHPTAKLNPLGAANKLQRNFLETSFV